jgi:hypothetical protein
MTLHVLYSPAHSDFVRDASGKPVVTEKPSPTRADAPAGSPSGTHWMQVTDEDDSTMGRPDSPAVKRGEPTIVLRGMHAVRLFPLVLKK